MYECGRRIEERVVCVEVKRKELCFSFLNFSLFLFFHQSVRGTTQIAKFLVFELLVFELAPPQHFVNLLFFDTVGRLTIPGRRRGRRARVRERSSARGAEAGGGAARRTCDRRRGSALLACLALCCLTREFSGVCRHNDQALSGAAVWRQVPRPPKIR